MATIHFLIKTGVSLEEFQSDLGVRVEGTVVYLGQEYMGVVLNNPITGGLCFTPVSATIFPKIPGLLKNPAKYSLVKI